MRKPINVNSKIKMALANEIKRDGRDVAIDSKDLSLSC